MLLRSWVLSVLEPNKLPIKVPTTHSEATLNKAYNSEAITEIHKINLYGLKNAPNLINVFKSHLLVLKFYMDLK